MKALLIILIAVLAIGFAFIKTKPTNSECYGLMKSQLQAAIARDNQGYPIRGVIANAIVGSRLTNYSLETFIRIEDNTFYKTIYSSINNQEIGTAYFGGLHVDVNLAGQINKLRSEAKISLPVFEHEGATPNVLGEDLASLQNQLDDAQIRLEKLKKFHLLRSSERRKKEIVKQELYIDALETKIGRLQQ